MAGHDRPAGDDPEALAKAVAKTVTAVHSAPANSSLLFAGLISALQNSNALSVHGMREVVRVSIDESVSRTRSLAKHAATEEHLGPIRPHASALLKMEQDWAASRGRAIASIKARLRERQLTLRDIALAFDVSPSLPSKVLAEAFRDKPMSRTAVSKVFAGTSRSKLMAEEIAKLSGLSIEVAWPHSYGHPQFEGVRQQLFPKRSGRAKRRWAA